MTDLKFNSVSKRYRVRHEREKTAAQNPFVQRLQSLLPKPAKDFWAVRDVSFAVERGEALGIIGHNGAGKSTILKLLSSITTPTSGEIMINGRLSALIEVGSGFHPELTGRENIYLSGSILGMRRREITEKLDSIVEFAGIRAFLDTPVKRFSSGMYVRLGFSIAAHLDPDILLLDEVLAVGDAAFQSKCLQRIEELRQAGTTIVFISHDLGAVERLCDRVLLMQRGEAVADGPAQQIIAEYQRSASNFVASSAPPGDNSANISKEAECVSLSFHDAVGHETSTFRTGDSLTARLRYLAHQPVANSVVSIFFYSENEELACQLTTGLNDSQVSLDPGTGEIEFRCDELGLQPGLYHIDTSIERYPEVIDWKYRCAMIRVDPGKIIRGNFYMPHQWQLELAERAGNKVGVEQTIGDFASKV